MIKWKASLMNDSYIIVRAVHKRESSILYMATYLLVHIKLAENLGGIKQVGVINNSSSRVVRKTYSTLRQYSSSRAAHFLMLYPSRGRLRIRATQYPLIKNKKVKKPWTAASGRM